MELKVLVDGIQRVVCGVTSNTTCQEVVFALAHATGQTGRFMLLEKWRHNERLLAPSEHPIDVLAKWGEYANDVMFVMKRSEQQAKSGQTTNAEKVEREKSDVKKIMANFRNTSCSNGVGSNLNNARMNSHGRPRRPPPYNEVMSNQKSEFTSQQPQSSNNVSPNNKSSNSADSLDNGCIHNSTTAPFSANATSFYLHNKQHKSNEESAVSPRLSKRRSPATDLSPLKQKAARELPQRDKLKDRNGGNQEDNVRMLEIQVEEREKLMSDKPKWKGNQKDELYSKQSNWMEQEVRGFFYLIGATIGKS